MIPGAVMTVVVNILDVLMLVLLKQFKQQHFSFIRLLRGLAQADELNMPTRGKGFILNLVSSP